MNDDQLLPAIPGGPPLSGSTGFIRRTGCCVFMDSGRKSCCPRRSPDFNLLLDPKCDWALRHLEQFPVEVMKADYDTLLRVPGIGYKSAQRIVKARRLGSLDYGMLKKMGVVLKRAIYFITCQGKQMYPVKLQEDFILRNILVERRSWPMGLTGEPEFRRCHCSMIHVFSVRII